MLAITREISPAIARCELTFLPRAPIDLARARAQHLEYERALADAGCTVERLSTASDLPDSVFVEDIAVAVDECAVIMRPGAEPRRAETQVVAEALGRHRRLAFIHPPATIDGGDVLVVGRRVFVGRSRRTDDAGIEQLRAVLAPSGYEVIGMAVRGCLHLKSAVTAVSADTLLVNRAWIPADRFADFTLLDVDPAEPHAANALLVRDVVIYPAAFPHTRARLEAHGFEVRPVEMDELAKAEGAVTCCSLILR